MAYNPGAYLGIYTAGNNHYHGVKSVDEHGALAHANKVAEVFLRKGLASCEAEALSLANAEIQRLRWNIDGIQINRIARDELRRERSPRPDAGSSAWLPLEAATE